MPSTRSSTTSLLTAPTVHAARREQIVRASLELVRDFGEDRMTMRQLGASIGVSATELYRYFEGKEAILHALQRYAVDEVGRWLDEEPRERGLFALCRSYLAFANGMPWLYRLAMRGAQPELRQLAIEAFTGRAAALVRQTGPAPDPDTLALQVWFSLHGLAMSLAEDRGEDRRTRLERDAAFTTSYLRAVLRGWEREREPSAAEVPTEAYAHG